MQVTKTIVCFKIACLWQKSMYMYHSVRSIAKLKKWHRGREEVSILHLQIPDLIPTMDTLFLYII